MKATVIPLFITFFLLSCVYGQNKPDTSTILKDIQINIYPSSTQKLRELPSAISVIGLRELSQSPTQTLLPPLNSVPGVRMEQRSPGSYRLSIRGSVLRSPFGVRNIKVYLDEFPLTDAGGNTYLNLIDPTSLSRIEIIRGPDGSLFGANTGGVVRLQTSLADTSLIHASTSAGQFGTFSQTVGLSTILKSSSLSINSGYRYADGYRSNSKLENKFAHARYLWNYSSKSSLTVSGFYTDLGYETPGGLTLAQAAANPRAARPATATVPGAAEQQAGIRNKTFFGGVSSTNNLTDTWRIVSSIYGSHTDFSNPFITNYELRDETNYGVRAFSEYLKQFDNLTLTWNFGLELQQSQTDLSNYKNNGGIKGTLQSSDNIKATSGFAFTRIAARVADKLNIEGSVSYAGYNYAITDLGNTNSKPELMPRLAAAFFPSERITLRTSVSRGFSPPNLAEIRPSGSVINQNLKPENGWNYEAGLRYVSKRNQITADLSAFIFKLQNTIVRRVAANDTEFFTNAGGTSQPGIEANIQGILLNRPAKVISYIAVDAAVSAYQFKFIDYISGNQNYSGNMLTGVPSTVIANGLNMGLYQSLLVHIQNLYTSNIFLNDANTVEADDYHLLQAKLSYKIRTQKIVMGFFIEADNILNEKYSLGNDLNAFGNRYYNPASTRNFTAGFSLSF